MIQCKSNVKVIYPEKEDPMWVKVVVLGFFRESETMGRGRWGEEKKQDRLID